MSDQHDSTTTTVSDGFQWHPEYSGQSYDSVRRELADCINRDQQAYHAALASAEKEEFGAFATVRDLEKRWSEYDFAWFEQQPEHLADKILQFEKERESRQELIDWQQWKRGSSPVAEPTSAPGEKGDWRENLSDDQRKKIASGLAIVVMLGGILLCIAAYYLVR